MKYGARSYALIIVVVVAPIFFSACGGGSGAALPPPPPPTTYTIGGTAVNLSGNGGLTLQDNGGDNLLVSANGAFKFASPLASGSSYSVTVLTQPSSPAQTCTVANGNGTAMANVMNISLDCGHNEWTWVTGTQTTNQIGTYGTLGVSAVGNTPGGRQYPATWTDASGNLWLFGGYGYDSDHNLLPFNDLWKFSAGQWTWMGGPSLAGAYGNYGTLGVASATNIPGARFESARWTDTAGDLWLFGGIGFDSAGNERSMNDLWKYSAGQWTWMGGSNVGSQNGNYGTLGVAASTNVPGARDGAMTWVDASGTAWLFGGLGYDASSTYSAELNDLWKYSGGQWTWMSGSKVNRQTGIYGAQGVPAASNTPGARFGAFSWTDASGNFWLYGGVGYDSNGLSSILNDLWKYSAGEWTWVSGSKVGNQPGIYGTQGVAAANNIPGARQFGISWTDSSGNGWLFGGNGYYSAGQIGSLNDLWKFSNGQWMWVAGSNVGNQNSAFGTQGTPAPGNTPGGRDFLNCWVDAEGNLWLFGGYGQSASGSGNLNDLWKYEP